VAYESAQVNGKEIAGARSGRITPGGLVEVDQFMCDRGEASRIREPRERDPIGVDVELHRSYGASALQDLYELARCQRRPADV
jgi:hypothetical protein